MKFRDVAIAVITNLAFIVAGHAMVLQVPELAAPALFTGIMGILSGIHHRFLRPDTRQLDYVGMYFALVSSGLFVAGVSTVFNLVLTAAAGLALIYKFGSSRVVVGVLAAPLLAAVYWLGGPYPFLSVSALGMIAYIFNLVGDHIHTKYHSEIHGGWHVVIAWAIALGMITIGVIRYG